MELFETWALTLIVFLPLAGALLIGIIPKTNEMALKGTGLLVAVAAFVVSLGVIAQFDFSGLPYNTYQFEVDVPWIGAINANYHLGVDGISLPLLVLSTFVMVLAVIYSWNHWEEPHNPKGFLDPDADPGHRAQRHVSRPRPGPLLHLLRGGPAPDVLHDRDLG